MTKQNQQEGDGADEQDNAVCPRMTSHTNLDADPTSTPHLQSLHTLGGLSTVQGRHMILRCMNPDIGCIYQFD